MDLTLECIRRHYAGEPESPLTDVLNAYADFFALFEGFKEFVDFFHLPPLLSTPDHARAAHELAVDTIEEAVRGGRDTEAAAAVERYRAEGKTVLLHCVRAESRTPTVAALYGARVAGVTALEALADLRRVLPGANPNPLFLGLLTDAENSMVPNWLHIRSPRGGRGGTGTQSQGPSNVLDSEASNKAIYSPMTHDSVKGLAPCNVAGAETLGSQIE